MKIPITNKTPNNRYNVKVRHGGRQVKCACGIDISGRWDKAIEESMKYDDSEPRKIYHNVQDLIADLQLLRTGDK